MLSAANQNQTPAGDLAAIYQANGLALADQPHLRLADMGFSQAEIMRAGETLLAIGEQAAAIAQQTAARFADAIAGLPHNETGLIICQLRGRGMSIAEIEILLTDIVGEAMRQQRLAKSGALS